MPNPLEQVFEQTTFEKGIADIYAATERVEERINSKMQTQLAAVNGAERSVSVRFTVQEWQLNVNNTLHGGIVMTAFDITMGLFANYLGYSQGKAAATVNMVINFLKAVNKGDTLLITAKTTSVGRRLVFLSGEARIEATKKLVSTADSTFFMIDRPADSQLNY